MSVYPVHKNEKANIKPDGYERLYAESISNPDAFWARMATEHLEWFSPWKKVSDCDYTVPRVNWFEGGVLNACYNCIDRHLEKRASQTAIIWEPDDPKDDSKHITYEELHTHVCKLANGLLELGVGKGDRVVIYMPMIPEAAYAMLACARVGAIHSVVFAGFSAEALRNRIEDAEASLVITADEGKRGGKTIPLKQTVDKALEGREPNTLDVLVVKHTGADVHWEEVRDCWYHDLVKDQPTQVVPEEIEATDPLFILYTSGSTGKPKGVVHSTGGYLLYASTTFKYVFDYQDGDVYWCTADVGWITGHSYIVYGPLASGATTVMFEGVPTYPDAGRCWDIVDKYNIAQFYTAPTALRTLEAKGDEFVKRSKRTSLRVLGTVGEPINPEVWEWYYKVVGNKKCPIVDTWWQTETGGHILTPLPYATALKPGSATKPFFGIEPILVDDKGQEISGEGEGRLCFKQSWPGQMIGVFNNPERFKTAYFQDVPGMYFSGDGCKRDADGDYWVTGRVDDVLNVSGHRIGTAEIESALVLNKHVSEAAVVGVPHGVKGEGIYAYVTLHSSFTPNEDIRKELIEQVRQEIGPIATIDAIQWTPSLPKTRSGKIMRRILRKVARGDFDELGDTSTLAEPEVVDELIQNRIEVPV